VFEGWYSSEACITGSEWNFATDTVPAFDFTLYAKWTRGRYQVSFDTQGRTSTPLPINALYEANLTEPTLASVIGYTFAGWYTSPTFADSTRWDFATSTMPGEPLILYAKWSVNTYEVRYEANGHGTAPSSVRVDFGTLVPVPAPISAQGYVFGGWFSDASYTPASQWHFATSTMPASDLMLYAKWTAVPSGGGSNAGGGSGGSGGTGTGGGSGGTGSGTAGAGAGSATGSNGSNDASGADGPDGDGLGADDGGGEGLDNGSGDENDPDGNGADGNGADGAGGDSQGSAKAEMPLTNLLLALLGILFAALVLIASRRQERPYRPWVLALTGILALCSLVLFFVLEPLSARIVWVDGYTVLFALVFVAELAVVVIGRFIPSR
jgi:uncharacterized repeat protein (TIGR02543 family)